MKTLLKTEDQYNLSPLAYPWALESYKKARGNFWKPEQVAMGRDLAQFRLLSDPEREMFLDVFATLTTSDLAIQENIAMRIYETLTPPEIRLWLGHQLADESLHSYSYQHVIECLSLDDHSIYYRYKEKPYLLQKFEIGNQYAQRIVQHDHFNKILGIAFFYLCWEGIWFYHGFTPIFALGRQGKLPGTCEQLQYIARDEVTHFEFGSKVVNGLLDEEARLYGNDLRKRPDFIKAIRAMFTELYEGEKVYAESCIRPILGYSAEIHLAHTRYLINVRLNQIGMEALYPNDLKAAVPWLSEMIELKKEKNFFETHVTEYQTGSQLQFESIPMDEIMNWNKSVPYFDSTPDHPFTKASA
ncbi:MAG: ribonucleotide-diphosphate reductase subunit beta [Methylococcaceae bacterium]